MEAPVDGFDYRTMVPERSADRKNRVVPTAEVDPVGPRAKCSMEFCGFYAPALLGKTCPTVIPLIKLATVGFSNGRATGRLATFCVPWPRT